MTSDLDTLLTALYVKIDDEIGDTGWLARPPRSTDSELVCLALAQVTPDFAAEPRWLRFVRIHARPASGEPGIGVPSPVLGSPAALP
ncbi:hypothetical protein ACH47Z_18710 [Streptomyces sp. NPDC020192]|uniref:hypothetical protein n=1 Tax=Streptomyces sp. NPDC020192 TaxID=3365066 RepID=UPI0037B05910